MPEIKKKFMSNLDGIKIIDPETGVEIDPKKIIKSENKNENSNRPS